MNIEAWRTQYAHLLEEVPLEHHYSDEAQPKDYKRLASHFDQDELGGRHGAKAFFSRPQIRRNGLRIVSRTVPRWFFNESAVRDFLAIQFPRMSDVQSRLVRTNGHDGETSETRTDTLFGRDEKAHEDDCSCAACRDRHTAALWLYVILHARMSQPVGGSRNGKPKNKMKVDTKNTDQEYWERVLRYHRHDLTEGEDDLDISPITGDYARRILQQIRFVAAGLRTDGKPRKHTPVAA